MVTSTGSVMGGAIVETAEEKAARITANRRAGIEKARAAKAALAKEPKDITKVPMKSEIENEVWRQAFFVLMTNYQTKAPRDLSNIGTLADTVLQHMKEVGRI